MRMTKIDQSGTPTLMPGFVRDLLTGAVHARRDMPASARLVEDDQGRMMLALVGDGRAVTMSLDDAAILAGQLGQCAALAAILFAEERRLG